MHTKWLETFLAWAILAFGALALGGCAAGAAPARQAASPGMAYHGGGAVAGMPATAAREEAMSRDGDGVPDDVDKEPAPEQPIAQNAPPPQSGQQGQPQRPQPNPSAPDAPHSPQLIIYTADVSLAVFQVENAMNTVENIGREVGGYLSQRSDNQIVIRVPRGRFQEALARIEPLGDVLHRNISAQDVTDQYVDLEARLKNAYAMRERLMELLKKAEVKDAIEIQRQLGEVTETIERLEGQLKLLKDKIAYSTITVSFQPVSSQSVAETQMNLPFPWLQELGLSALMAIHN